jgi:hypothetical protein
MTAPAFRVRVSADAPEGAARAAALVEALLDFPFATDDDLARLTVTCASTGPSRADEPRADAYVFAVAGAPDTVKTAALAALPPDGAIFVAFDAGDAPVDEREALEAAWTRAGQHAVFVLRKAPGRPDGLAGVDELRAALVALALERAGAPVERLRRAKRPYATAIIAGAALVTAAEGFLPGTMAFVLTTQVGAIHALHLLYSGRWLGRSQALALLPVFLSEAAGGSMLLFVKSFLPPTGVADVLAAATAASMTMAMLGSVAWVLERGTSLGQKAELRAAFRRLRARTRTERAQIARERHRWTERAFWADIVQRSIFE